MSKRTPVTYHEVFKYLSSKTGLYPEGFFNARKRAIRIEVLRKNPSRGWRPLLRPELTEEKLAECKRKAAVDS